MPVNPLCSNLCRAYFLSSCWKEFSIDWGRPVHKSASICVALTSLAVRLLFPFCTRSVSPQLFEWASMFFVLKWHAFLACTNQMQKLRMIQYCWWLGYCFKLKSRLIQIKGKLTNCMNYWFKHVNIRNSYKCYYYFFYYFLWHFISLLSAVIEEANLYR